MRRAVEHVLTHAAPSQDRACEMLSIRDLVITDAMVICPHEMLADTSPACRTNLTEAALELHAVVQKDTDAPQPALFTMCADSIT